MLGDQINKCQVLYKAVLRNVCYRHIKLLFWHLSIFLGLWHKFVRKTLHNASFWQCAQWYTRSNWPKLSLTWHVFVISSHTLVVVRTRSQQTCEWWPFQMRQYNYICTINAYDNVLSVAIWSRNNFAKISID